MSVDIAPTSNAGAALVDVDPIISAPSGREPRHRHIDEEESSSPRVDLPCAPKLEEEPSPPCCSESLSVMVQPFPAPARSTVAGFLSSLSLEQYVACLLREGFDSLLALSMITERDLCEFGVKRGHQRVILGALRKLTDKDLSHARDIPFDDSNSRVPPQVSTKNSVGIRTDTRICASRLGDMPCGILPSAATTLRDIHLPIPLRPYAQHRTRTPFNPPHMKTPGGILSPSGHPLSSSSILSPTPGILSSSWHPLLSSAFSPTNSSASSSPTGNSAQSSPTSSRHPRHMLSSRHPDGSSTSPRHPPGRLSSRHPHDRSPNSSQHNRFSSSNALLGEMRTEMPPYIKEVRDSQSPREYEPLSSPSSTCDERATTGSDSESVASTSTRASSPVHRFSSSSSSSRSAPLVASSLRTTTRSASVPPEHSSRRVSAVTMASAARSGHSQERTLSQTLSPASKLHRYSPLHSLADLAARAASADTLNVGTSDQHQQVSTSSASSGFDGGTSWRRWHQVSPWVSSGVDISDHQQQHHQVSTSSSSSPPREFDRLFSKEDIAGFLEKIADAEPKPTYRGAVWILKEHLRSIDHPHADQANLPHVRRICAKIGLDLPTRREHIPSIAPDGTPMFTCPLCPSKSYKYRQGLYRHTRIAHTDTALIKCDVCQKSFTSGGSLRAHKESVHMGIKYECPVCTVEFTLKGSRRKHMRAMHGMTSTSSA